MLFDHMDSVGLMGDTSALVSWMDSNGKDTIIKYKQFEKAGFNDCLSFSGQYQKLNLKPPKKKLINLNIFSKETNNHKFEAFIDPENKFSLKDKFSQVSAF